MKKRKAFNAVEDHWTEEEKNAYKAFIENIVALLIKHGEPESPETEKEEGEKKY